METKQVIVVRKDLQMRKGKIAAQVSHASMAFLTHTMKHQVADEVTIFLTKEEQEWMRHSFAKVVCYVDSEQELGALMHQARLRKLTVHEIIDSGRTEFHGVPTLTCAAFGPHDVSKFVGLTDHLKLL